MKPALETRLSIERLHALNPGALNQPTACTALPGCVGHFFTAHFTATSLFLSVGGGCGQREAVTFSAHGRKRRVFGRTAQRRLAGFGEDGRALAQPDTLRVRRGSGLARAVSTRTKSSEYIWFVFLSDVYCGASGVTHTSQREYLKL